MAEVLVGGLLIMGMLETGRWWRGVLVAGVLVEGRRWRGC